MSANFLKLNENKTELILFGLLKSNFNHPTEAYTLSLPVNT